MQAPSFLKAPSTAHTQAQRTPSALLETITPEIAEELLKNNRMGNNRRVRQTRVDYYADMITRGAWDMNGGTVVIASDGALLDGQHRLLAVVKAGVPIDTIVVRGVHPQAFFTIDDGLIRNNGDHLFTNGHKTNSSILAAAAKFCMSFDKDGVYRRIADKVPPDRIIWYADRNPGLYEACRYISQIKKLMPAAVGVAMYYMFSIVDETAAELFFDSLFSGADLREGDPILTVRNRLLSKRRGEGSNIQTEIIHVLVTAFNSYRAGKKMYKMVHTLESVTTLDGFKGQLADGAFATWG